MHTILLSVVIFVIAYMDRVHGLNTVLWGLKAQLASKPIYFQQRMMYHQNPKEANRDEIESIISMFDDEIEQNDSRKNTLQLLKGLFLLRVDSALDDAHECIQFLSQDDPSVCYAHSLVHKLEGTNRGEMGLTGYSNCAYWIELMGTSNFPTYNDLAQCASTMRKKRFSSSQAVCTFVDNDLRCSGEHYEWDALKFLALCMDMGEEEHEVFDFCETIVKTEWELLVDHILNQYG